MNKDDFSFLTDSGFLVLFVFLTLIATAQIALEQQFRMSLIEPFLVLNLSLLESLGLLLPVFASFYFFLYNRNIRETEWLPPRKWIFIFVIFYLAIIFIPIPEPVENIIVPDSNTTTSLLPGTTTPVTTSTIITSTTNTGNSGPTTNEMPSFSLLENFRNIILFGILLLPIILIFIIQRRSDEKIFPVDEGSGKSEVKEKTQYSTRSILECYYQASTALEERGAETSDSLTPTEFDTDVKEKDLTRPNNIDGLTELFEEAKFSIHIITDDQVALAKKLAGNILFPSGEPEDINLETNDSEKKEREEMDEY